MNHLPKSKVAVSLALALGLGVGLSACNKKAEQAAPTGTVTAAAQAPLGVAYVSSQDGGIAVYNLADQRRIRDIVVGEGARGLAISDDGSRLVVAVKSAGDLAIIDTLKGEVVARVPVGKNPEFVRLMGDLAFVAYEPSAKGGPPPKPGEVKALEREDDDDEDDDEPPAQVAVVDWKKALKIKEITAGKETEGIEFSQDGKHLIVTNESDENVSVHAIDTGALVTRVDTRSYGMRPRGIKRAPDGQHFAVTLEYGNKILILNNKYQVVKEAATGEVPYGVTYNKAGDEIVVALSRGEKLQVFDSQTLQLKREYPVGKRCWHFSFTPDEKQLWVACGRSSEIMVLDAKTGAKLTGLPDSQLPWGVVVYPKAKGSLDTPL